MAYPSDFVTIRNSVIAKLRLDATYDVARVEDWINQVYTELVCETEYLQDGSTMPLIAGVCSYSLPTAIFRFKLVRGKTDSGDWGPPLQEVSIDDLAEMRYLNGDTTGSAVWFALVGSTRLEIHPTPDAASPLHMYYVKFPSPLVSDTDLPILAEPYGSKAIEYGVLAEAADFLGDPNENNYRQLSLYWRRKLQQHKNRVSGGAVWQLPIANWRVMVPADNAADYRGL